MQVENIRIIDIDTRGQQVRDGQDDDFTTELAMSIAKHGLLEPIVIRRKTPEEYAESPQKYQLLDGAHRLFAHVRLNRETIAAHVRQNDETAIKAIATIGNIIRREMTLDEEVTAVRYLEEVEHLSVSSICDTLSKSRAWVEQRMAIRGMHDDVREELLNGRISISGATAIDSVDDRSIRATILNQAISCNLNARQIRDLVSCYLEAPSISEAIEAGVQAQREIQESSPTKRQCACCGAYRDIVNIQYIAVCVPCKNAIETTDQQEHREEVAGNGI